MNELDVVRVKETVTVTPNFEDDPIEIKAGWRGQIVAHSEKPNPLIEFDEQYRGQPFLVALDAANLELVWESMSKTIYVQPPIIVKELADRIGISPYLLIHDLLNMSVFVRVNQII